MPANNRFRHQAYRPPPESLPVHLCTATRPPSDSEEFRQRMSRVGAALERSGVVGIWLVHGTFVGSDALGVIRDIARFAPGSRRRLQTLQKQFVDKFVQDRGNFTDEFADRFAAVINTGRAAPIPVRLFSWSGENHHIGRADGAVCLIDELHRANYPAGSRLLLWGHSHAGNVFALMTNLLGGDPSVRDQFFHAARSWYRLPFSHRIDMPAWQNVRDLCRHSENPLGTLGLDVVTFGTPVRYGWDSGGYGRLLHFIHHRPVPGLPRWQAAFPPSLESLLTAADGDTIQQFGIAGTNLAPGIHSWRAWLAESRLRRLLQPGLRKRDLWRRLSVGLRVHDEGETLLVDYPVDNPSIAAHIAGHAVYTRGEWLPFHAEEIVTRWYADSP